MLSITVIAAAIIYIAAPYIVHSTCVYNVNNTVNNRK